MLILTSHRSRSLRYNGWIILECPPFLIGLHLVEHEGRSQAIRNCGTRQGKTQRSVTGPGFLKLWRSLGAESPIKAAKRVGSCWFDGGSSLVHPQNTADPILKCVPLPEIFFSIEIARLCGIAMSVCGAAVATFFCGRFECQERPACRLLVNLLACLLAYASRAPWAMQFHIKDRYRPPASPYR